MLGGMEGMEGFDQQALMGMFDGMDTSQMMAGLGGNGMMMGYGGPPTTDTILGTGERVFETTDFTPMTGSVPGTYADITTFAETAWPKDPIIQYPARQEAGAGQLCGGNKNLQCPNGFKCFSGGAYSKQFAFGLCIPDGTPVDPVVPGVDCTQFPAECKACIPCLPCIGLNTKECDACAPCEECAVWAPCVETPQPPKPTPRPPTPSPVVGNTCVKGIAP